ncbi:MAG: amidophosphoribosyltransferase [Deltaproteobacteria bacterium]|nr:amidophosphoribosyltransferase [Deltaproteobacteria bacterium]
MCGIVGISNHPEAANLAYLCLHGLQHRGQESAGIVVSDGQGLAQHKGMGLASDIFTREVLAGLRGAAAIGHTRYSTTGESAFKNAQPFVINYAKGWLAIAHNGNLTNARALRRELEAGGSIFQSTMDSEVFMHLIAREPSRSLEERIIDACKRVQGAYSLVFLSEDRLIAVRDPYGWRPLVLGTLDDAIVVASETCAFDLIEATFLREVEPGEMVVIGKEGMTSTRMFPPQRRAHCIFEYIYFARPDSHHLYGRNVYRMRVGLGEQLAREQPADADVVVPVPDSGLPAAIGYAKQSGMPFAMGMIRSHYVGRTFIEPEQAIRDFGVKLKLNPVREALDGKRVALIDDSIMRGTTMRKIVRMIRHAGATEVHVRISAPPTRSPCYYGIDIPTSAELIAANKSVEETRAFINADSLGYLSREGLYFFEKRSPNEWFCDACFTGDYPVEPADMVS